MCKYIGRVQHMIKPSPKRGKIEYKQLVNLDDVQNQNIEVQLNMYEQYPEIESIISSINMVMIYALFP